MRGKQKSHLFGPNGNEWTKAPSGNFLELVVEKRKVNIRYNQRSWWMDLSSAALHIYACQSRMNR